MRSKFKLSFLYSKKAVLLDLNRSESLTHKKKNSVNYTSINS